MFGSMRYFPSPAGSTGEGLQFAKLAFKYPGNGVAMERDTEPFTPNYTVVSGATGQTGVNGSCKAAIQRDQSQDRKPVPINSARPAQTTHLLSPQRRGGFGANYAPLSTSPQPGARDSAAAPLFQLCPNEASYRPPCTGGTKSPERVQYPYCAWICRLIIQSVAKERDEFGHAKLQGKGIGLRFLTDKTHLNGRTLLVVLVVFLLIIDLVRKRRPRNFPPGPQLFPLVGTFVDFKQPLHLALQKLTGRYGNIFSVQFGSLTFVVVNGYQMVREALVHQAEIFTDRPNIPLLQEIFRGFGLISSNGHIWRQQRKFASATLKSIAVSFEEKVQEESRYLVETIEEEKVFIAVLFLKFKGDTSSYFHEENLLCSTLDLFLTGTETTATAIRWALLYMTAYPDIQEKVQLEIDTVIGQSRQPTMADKENMPYTSAVLSEVLRMGNVVPLGVPKMSTSDTTLAGFHLPKGTTLMTSLTSIMFDKNVWETPDTFNPEHFLENGQYRRREAFLPFSAVPHHPPMLRFLWESISFQMLLIFLVVFLLVADYMKHRKPKNFPPSPFRIPFLGHVYMLNFSNPQIMVDKLTEKYGDVFSTELGSTAFVCVNGMRLIKEALVNQGENFIDRPDIPIDTEVFSKIGLISSNGHLWKQQRRFTLTTLRNFGLGKRSLEERIQEECRYLTDAFGDEQGNPFDPHFKINNAVSNIICSVTFGNRFEYHDEDFQKLLQLMDETVTLHGSIASQLYNSFPSIMKFLPGSHQTIFKNWRKLKCFVKERIDKHKEDWNPSESRDFIDSYLQEIAKANGDGSFQEENLVACALDLLFAGTETTSTTIRWALLYMAMYPEIQARVQAEIDAVIGQARQPSLEDRNNLPYTNAVIHEVQRKGNIVPFNVPRLAVKDTMLDGFFIPKVTLDLSAETLARESQVSQAQFTRQALHAMPNKELKKLGKEETKEAAILRGMQSGRLLKFHNLKPKFGKAEPHSQTKDSING
ncbi:cytochrome p450 2j2-like [Limosa lapponica baueri]|uniref:Cytochrome p450 2j2-like n=1 Tax=Limosa lapponica baueri TaxID=1758121 RepID=A0A2I0TPI4_LIMLA|nr:cytochrome p450 2j2-like [Limosa lapponica baueri]